MIPHIHLIDTETTGTGKLDQVIQLASIKISNDRQELVDTVEISENTHQIENKFFSPSVPINKFAQEVHGLSKLKLIKYPSADTVRLPEDITMFVAHNAPFDKRFIARTDERALTLPYICTMSLAKKIEKLRNGKYGFKNYQLISMFDFFYPELTEEYKQNHHDALGDCIMTLMVLIKLWDSFPFIHTLHELQEYFFEN